MKKQVLLLVFIFAGNFSLALAEGIPVMLFLSARDQADTLGYNVVEQLPQLVYSEIMSGRIPLWDSPKKELQIKPSTLRRIEESSGTEFIHSPQLFIYELWELDAKQGSLQTIGFYFSNRSQSREEISYGYVDYEPLAELLRHTSISTNENGNCFTSFETILSNKYYYYNVMQYGERKVTSLNEALSLKNQVADLVSSRTSPASSDCKVVTYSLEDSSSEVGLEKKLTHSFLNGLEDYLNENREVFYNMGGERIRSFLQPGRIHVSSVEVTERWKTDANGILYEPESLRIFVEGKPLDKITPEEVSKLEFLTNFKSPADFINEKEFYFRITRINGVDIPEQKAAAYLNALKSWKWNLLTEFVKYE